ncbi:MAG TPA: DinB family protein [Propionibacteriaceae bacterium]|nr:DinB family protein [Propionibacteriaceae bacterium]
MSDTAAAWQADERPMLEAFLDDYRAGLRSCLDGLTEEQARRSLVPSLTTLLGLVKHATFVELAWFDEGITFRDRSTFEVGASVDESFTLGPDDTIASVLERYDAACEASRRRIAGMSLDDLVRGNRRGPISLRWVVVHCIAELAQHAGHADILREQILAADGSPAS